MLDDVKFALKWGKVYWKIRPQIEQIRKLSHMRLTTSSCIQILMGLVNIANVLDPYLSGKAKIVIAATSGCLVVIINAISSNHNPDGTPAVCPYIPPDKDKRDEKIICPTPTDSSNS